MARVSGLTTGLTIRYLKQGDSLNGDSIVNNFDGWSATDSSDLAQNSSWWTAGNGLIRNFEQNFLARDFTFALKHFKADAAAASDISVVTTSTTSAAVPVPASSPLHYYLKIDDLKGDSTVKGLEGWFAVDGYDIGVHNTGSIGSAGGGAGAGKAQFSPLTVDIHSLAGLASLFGDVAAGRALKSGVELVGVETIKDQNIKLYDVKLSDVLVSSFKQRSRRQGSRDGADLQLRQDQSHGSAGREEWDARHSADLQLGPASRTRRTPRWPRATSPSTRNSTTWPWLWRASWRRAHSGRRALRISHPHRLRKTTI